MTASRKTTIYFIYATANTKTTTNENMTVVGCSTRFGL